MWAGRIVSMEKTADAYNCVGFFLIIIIILEGS